MKLQNSILSLTLSMFVNSPSAWGGAQSGLSTFTNRVRLACTQSFIERLNDWEGISPVNRQRIAVALCDDERIFWPFAGGQSTSELAPTLEQRFRHAPAYAPLQLGLFGASASQSSEILHAIRQLLYPLSNTVYRWAGDTNALRTWQNNDSGGRFGGVIQVDIGGDSAVQARRGVQRAMEAMSYTMSNQMDSYVLVLTAAEDIRARFISMGAPIRWVALESSDCAAGLRR